ncbi:MAG: hypothetical protein ABII82_10175 [Verrucomicrobiota bacterium]
MNTIAHYSTSRTYRRLSATAIGHLAATPRQAARLAGLTAEADHDRLWDGSLLDRLATPLSRIRE